MFSPVLTEDGSMTLADELTGVSYHSTKGALQETRHIFIETGLHHAMQRFQQIKLLEIGFGTGLNALMTAIAAGEKQHHVHYTAVEKFPVSDDIFKFLNHGNLPGADAGLFHEILAAKWNGSVDIHPHFTLHKIKADALEAELPASNLVYYDAFAPQVQPELWDSYAMRRIFECLLPGGNLVTYCVQGEFRRTLKALGFSIEKLSGPPGKREILRATKPLETL